MVHKVHGAHNRRGMKPVGRSIANVAGPEMITRRIAIYRKVVELEYPLGGPVVHLTPEDYFALKITELAQKAMA